MFKVDEEDVPELVDMFVSEFRELGERIKSKTLTAGAVWEAGFDLVSRLVVLAIPGTFDDMALEFFGPMVRDQGAKLFDKISGVSKDASRLMDRAADRRSDARDHLEKAIEKEAAGKDGGFLSKSPEAHRRRAEELNLLAERDEAKALELQSTKV